MIRIRYGSGSIKIFRKGSGSVWFSRIRATLIFIKEFSEIFEICSFDTNIFSEKFPITSRKLSEIFQLFWNRKNIVLLSKIVQNDYIAQNLAKFSPELRSTVNFSFKTFFLNSRRLWRRKFVVLSPKNWFFVVRVSTKAVVSLTHLWSFS